METIKYIRSLSRAIPKGTESSHDRLRNAVEQHGLDVETIAARVKQANPGTTISQARFYTLQLLEGGTATWPVADAILDIIVERKHEAERVREENG